MPQHPPKRTALSRSFSVGIMMLRRIPANRGGRDDSGIRRSSGKLGAFLSVSILGLLIFLTGCAEYAEFPADWKITTEPIPNEALPRLDFKTAFGYAIFEGELCRVERRNGQFSLCSLEGERLFPSPVVRRHVPLCWNRTLYFHRSYTPEADAASKAQDNVSAVSDVHRTYPSDAVAHIGDFYLKEKQRCPFYVMQYRNRIAFSTRQEIPFTTDLKLDEHGSFPILFHGRMIRVSKPKKKILFLDAETEEVLQASEYTAGWLVAVGVIGRGDESLLVVIKSVAPYEPESEIWFFNADFLRFKEPNPRLIKGRHWSMAAKDSEPDTLFVYETFCGPQIRKGFKIILNTGK